MRELICKISSLKQKLSLKVHIGQRTRIRFQIAKIGDSTHDHTEKTFEPDPKTRILTNRWASQN